MSEAQKFDSWLKPAGPVAIALREPLQPAMGADAVFFPPTFAPFAKGDPPSYVVDQVGQQKTVVVDTVGSQANRLEPVFKQAPYSELVPQAIIKVGDRPVNLLDAGHRAADALVRFSSKAAELTAAFRAIADSGDAAPLAKLAPTSLVFGVWDSRGAGVKIPRLLGSTIRAYDVEPLTRAAQYFSAFEKDETEAFGQTQDFLSEQGFSDAPAGRTHGGVVARGGVRREAILNLSALRGLSASSPEQTLALERYILGLALVALTAPANFFLREGCLLVGDPERPAVAELVFRTGAREAFSLAHDDALQFARAAASAFGVGKSWEADFNKSAVADVAARKTEAKGKKAKAG